MANFDLENIHVFDSETDYDNFIKTNGEKDTEISLVETGILTLDTKIDITTGAAKVFSLYSDGELCKDPDKETTSKSGSGGAVSYNKSTICETEPVAIVGQKTIGEILNLLTENMHKHVITVNTDEHHYCNECNHCPDSGN